MRHIRAVLLGAAVITGATSFAAAQAVVPVQWGWGRRDNDDRQAFQEGYRQGQSDARHNRRFDADDSRWRERDDRQAYRNGYARGFREAGSYGNNGGYGAYGRDRDGDYDGNRGGWGRGGYGGYNNDAGVARQYGYQDGLNDGSRDRQTGHSNRPTESSNYKHADRGYSGRYGNKDYYKQAYREAYQNGYEQGYGYGGVYRRR